VGLALVVVVALLEYNRPMVDGWNNQLSVAKKNLIRDALNG